MHRIRLPLAALSAALLVCAPPASAQFRDWLSGNAARNGSTVADFLKAIEKTNSQYSAQLARMRGNVGLVFVPGILGSALKSSSGEEIWGYGLRLSPALALPAALIDPAAEPGITATLADGTNGRIDLYGTAMTLMREHAARAGIAPGRIAACGYDWRRDIRAGARDLARCIDSAPELKGIEALIVVAHSMGGLVTFQWHRDNTADGVLKNGVPVIALAALGSPLAGSCEILRMVATGYVQPTASERHANESWLGRFATEVRTMRDRLVNAVTGFFTSDVRPLVLSWPGALELSPPAAATREQANCAPIPLTTDDTDPRIRTHYDPGFWSGDTGRALLSGKAPPAAHADVLAVARAFREAFRLEPLASPTYLYASEIWDTPAQPKLVPPSYVPDDRGLWQTADGDGRVPFSAALPVSLQIRAADALRVYSVHGNLPEDKVFLQEFFGQRVPRLLQGWYTLRLATEALGDAAFLKSYVAAGGRQLHPYDLHGAWERQSEQNQRDPIYRLTREAWNAAVDFNEALCAVSPCPDYAAAKSAASAAQSAGQAERAAIYSAALRNADGLSDDQQLFVIAKRGLEMANRMNWVAAIGDLRFAAPKLAERAQRIKRGETENERRLRIDATANLARALIMRGFCAEAAGHLRSVPANNRWAMDARDGQCFDRDSGRIVLFSQPAR